MPAQIHNYTLTLHQRIYQTFYEYNLEYATVILFYYVLLRE